MHPDCQEGKISIITVNYNGLEDTCGLIDSIPVDDRLEIIVVDNASVNNEASIIAAKYPHVKTVRSEENNGFSAGNNLGFYASTGEFLFFLNNDAYLSGTDEEKLTGLFALSERLESDKKIALVCPKIRFAWDDAPIQYAGYTPLSRITVRNRAIGFGEADHGQHDAPHSTPYAHGAAVMTKREFMEDKVNGRSSESDVSLLRHCRVATDEGRASGLWPENFFLYYEEIDWSLTFLSKGFQIWYEPRCTIYHKESKSTGQDSPLRVYYLTRNRLLLASRHFSPQVKPFTYFYLICIAATKNALKYMFQGHMSHAKAVVAGVSDFCHNRLGRRT